MKINLLSIMFVLAFLSTPLQRTYAVNNLSVCNGDSLKIGLDSLPSNFISGNQNLTVKWNGTIYADNFISRYVNPTSNAVYILELHKGAQHYKDTFNVTVRAKPALPSFASDTTVIFGDLMRLDFNSSKQNGVQHRWNNRLSDSIVTFYPMQDSSNILKVINEYGCYNYKNITVKIKNPIYLVVKDTIKFHNSQKINGNIRIGHAGIDSLFRKYKVKSISKVPCKVCKKDERLNRVYEIISNDNVDTLFQALCDYDSLFSLKYIGKPGFYRKASAPGYHPDDWLTFATPHALAAMRMPEAWAITKGNAGIHVAILDEGYPNMYHEDLAGKVNVHSNPGFPYTGGNEHATCVAGCIAAIGNNNLGVVGSGYNIGVTGYYFPSGLFASWQALDEVFDMIMNDGIRIVSISTVGGAGTLVQDVIDEYHEKGLVIVAAAGNSNGGISEILYPASYNHVISVAGVSTEGVLGSIVGPALDNYSVDKTKILHGPTNGYNYNDKVDISAPCMKVRTTGDESSSINANNEYSDPNGTSFSAPLVAGVCGLILSVNPCFSADDIEYLIKHNATPIADDVSGQAWHNKLGAGFIDAKATLDEAVTYGTVDLTVVQNQNITLSSVNKTYPNITIEAGGVLTIDQSEIFIKPNGRILVKKGGKLIGLNSLISMNRFGICNANSDWVGIVIEGDPTKEQNNLAYHGFVNLYKCTLNLARTGVMLGTGTWGSGGGVLVANDCDFTCRYCGIMFNSYVSPTGLNNTCSINRCKFTIPFHFPTISNVYSNMQQYGISLVGVKGVKINGCDFLTNVSDPSFFVGTHTGWDRIAIGVNSYNSSVTVQDDKAVAFPYKAQTIGTFKNIDIGVYHVGFSPDQNINVNNNNFITCGKGVKLNGGTNSKIYRNNFSLTLFNTDNCTVMSKEIGISAYNANGTIITENRFFNTQQYAPYDLITCNNRSNKYFVGSVVNITANPVMLASLYTHNSLKYGMSSSQFEVDNSNTRVRCNDYDHHLDAVSVYGINPNFGNCNTDRIDRMNTYTNSYTWGDVCNFNLTGKSYDYLVSNSNPKPPMQTGYVIPTASVNIITSCIQGTINPFPCSTTWEIAAENSTRNGDVTSGKAGGIFILFDQLKLKKQLLIGGGSLTLEQSVISGNSGIANDIRDNLISHSPYLSDAVLNAVLTYGSYFSAAQITDILIANSALADEIYQAALANTQLLNDETAMAMVVSAQFNINQRSILESEIVDLTNDYYEARTTYIDSLLYLHEEDSLNNANYYYINQLIDLLENQEDEDNKYLLLPLYCSTNNGTKITTEAAKFRNNITEEKAFKDIVLFNYDVMQGLADAEYLADHHERITEIADNTTLFASPGADGLLEMVYGETRNRYPLTSDEVNLGKRSSFLKEERRENNSMLKLSPNPSEGEVTITLKGIGWKQGTLIQVMDLAGNQILETSFDLHRSDKVIDLTNLKNGVYFVKVVLYDGRTFNEKLVYVK